MESNKLKKTRKPPQVKQTLTSLYRIAKSNPLTYVYQNTQESANLHLDKMKLPESVTGVKNFSLVQSFREQNATLNGLIGNLTSSKIDLTTPKPKEIRKITTSTANSKLKPQKPSTHTVSNPKPAKSTSNLKPSVPKPVANTASSKNNIPTRKTIFNTGTVPNTNLNRRATLKADISKTLLKNSNQIPPVNLKTEPISKPKPPTAKSLFQKPKQTINPVKQKVPLRRSISAQHFSRNQRGLQLSKPEQKVVHSQQIQSLESLDKLDFEPILELSPIQPITKKSIMKTPSIMNKWRSIPSETPGSELKVKSRMSNGPPMIDIQNRLNHWLKKRGKPISTFHHLKYFADKNTKEVEDDENKENIDKGLVDSESYENLHIICKTPVKDEPLEAMKLKNVVRDALDDLNNLINEGYPLDQCQQWLALIRKKYVDIEEEHYYWECRASIEQKIGNISSAVECLKTSIVKGAEVTGVDKSLEKLLEKFSVLNIESSMETDLDTRKKQGKDFLSFFKCSIIQFAVQERSIKKSKIEETPKKIYVATPVRRSTRLSRSAYKSTPGVKIFNTLHELDKSVQDNISFQTNNYLK